MSVPEQDSDPFAFYARRLTESTLLLVAANAVVDRAEQRHDEMVATHEHEVAERRITAGLLAEYRRCMVALLGDNLPDGHRAWVTRLLARVPVGE